MDPVMNFIRLPGENVYTTPYYTIQKNDIARSRNELGTIIAAYFFANQDGRYRKTKFNRDIINIGQGGLMVTVRPHSAKNFQLPIYRLENITRFLTDMQALGEDISFLKGKFVSAYMHGEPLIGIGVISKE